MYDGEPVFAHHGDTRMLHSISSEKSDGGRRSQQLLFPAEEWQYFRHAPKSAQG